MVEVIEIDQRGLIADFSMIMCTKCRLFWMLLIMMKHSHYKSVRKLLDNLVQPVIGLLRSWSKF